MPKVEHSIHLDPKDVTEALLAKAYEVARRAGVAPPPEAFHSRAVVHPRAVIVNDAPITAHSIDAHVTWED